MSARRVAYIAGLIIALYVPAAFGLAWLIYAMLFTGY